jgi:hypothetical protein
MKVYFNGYPNPWLSPYTIIDYAFFWTPWSKCHRDRGIVEDRDFVDRPAWVEPWAERLDPICQVIRRVREKINPQIRLVKIDPYDTWSMDHTLAHIIHPMLIQLQATKHGAPFTDDEDVPEHLRSTSAPPRENEWDTDANHFVRWDWILDEMIWAFAQELRDDDEAEFYDHSQSDSADWNNINETLGKIKVDRDGLKSHQDRKANGFRLFGKYYQALWD